MAGMWLFMGIPGFQVKEEGVNRAPHIWGGGGDCKVIAMTKRSLGALEQPVEFQCIFPSWWPPAPNFTCEPRDGRVRDSLRLLDCELCHLIVCWCCATTSRDVTGAVIGPTSRRVAADIRLFFRQEMLPVPLTPSTQGHYFHSPHAPLAPVKRYISECSFKHFHIFVQPPKQKQ